MNDSTVLIEEAEMPNILVNGSKYELFCEFAAKSGGEQSIYVAEQGNDVIVRLEQDRAILNFFSAEQGKIKELFDYIEALIARKDGLICFESESFPSFLKMAIAAGGRYPIIQNELHPKKHSFLSGVLPRFPLQHALDKSFQEQILKHTVPVDFKPSPANLSYSSEYSNEEDDFPNLRPHMSTETFVCNELSSNQEPLDSKIQSAVVRCNDEAFGSSKNLTIESSR